MNPSTNLNISPFNTVSMVALEVFTVSALFTAGNLVKYFYDKINLVAGAPDDELKLLEEPVDKFVELSVERSNYSPPLYVNSGSIGIPLGGGTTTEFYDLLSAVISKKENLYNWRITDLDTRNRCASTQKFWLNTPDDLKTFFEQHRIPMNIVPLSLPIQVREVKVPPNTPIYGVKSAVTIGSHKESVIKTAAWNRSFGRNPRASAFAALMTVTLGGFLWLTRDDYYERLKRERYIKAFGLS